MAKSRSSAGFKSYTKDTMINNATEYEPNPPTKSNNTSDIFWDIPEETELYKVITGYIETEETKKDKEFQQLVEKIMKEIENLLIAKNKAYGDKNLLSFGLLGILVRLNDKLARLRNFLDTGNQDVETVEDTLKDIAGYAINALRLIKQGKMTPYGE